MQMGVEVHAMTTPLTKSYRDSLRADQRDQRAGGAVQSRCQRQLRAVNEILAAKGTVSFAGDEISLQESIKGSSIRSWRRIALRRLRTRKAASRSRLCGSACTLLQCRASTRAGRDGCWSSTSFRLLASRTPTSRAVICSDKFDVIVLPDHGRSADYRTAGARAPFRNATPAASAKRA